LDHLFLLFFGFHAFFWDFRYLLFFFALALFTVFTSGIPWKDMSRAWIFIIGFILFFIPDFSHWPRGHGALY
jgi:energy-coupling factor transport system permease protein